MPSTDNELRGSILAFAAEGTYPESQDVVAAEFPVSSLPEEIQRISEARTQVQVGRAFEDIQFLPDQHMLTALVLPRERYHH